MANQNAEFFGKKGRKKLKYEPHLKKQAQNTQNNCSMQDTH